MKPTPYRPLEEAGFSTGKTAVSLALAFAGLAALLAGCIPTSVHPVYRVADLVEDPALLGIWQSTEGKDRWTFTQGEDKSYNLKIQTDDQTIACVAHLFKLGDERFLDLYPAERPLNAKLENNPYSIGLVPVHAFFRVRATSPALRLSAFGLDWLKDLLKRSPDAAPHVVLPDGRVVLTGRTDALQVFIKKHLSDTEAWDSMYGDGLNKAVPKPPAK